MSEHVGSTVFFSSQITLAADKLSVHQLRRGGAWRAIVGGRERHYLHAVQRTDPPTSEAKWPPVAQLSISACVSGETSIHDRPLGWAIEAGSAKVAAGAIASKTV